MITPICRTCNTGFYLESNVCKACTENCETCSATGCSKCKSPYILTDSRGTPTVTKICVASCPNTTFQTSTTTQGVTTQSCTPCIENCATCTEATKCVTCNPGTILSTNKDKCTPCPTGCLTCPTAFNKCEVCQTGFFRTNTDTSTVGCVPSCPTGTFPTTEGTAPNTVQVCKQCSTNCARCTDQTGGACTLC